MTDTDCTSPRRRTTDRATERLAEVLQETPGPTCTCPEELMRTVCSSCTAKRFTAQGVGFREDHVRKFAEWADGQQGEADFSWWLNRYLSKCRESEGGKE